MFLPSISYEMPAASVVVLESVEVFGRGPLRHRNNYLDTSFVSPQEAVKWRNRRGHWRASLERIVQRRSRIETPVLWITDNWSCGYYHWMLDALPRLQLASQSYDLSKVTLLLPCKFRRYDFFLESLKAFGLAETRILKRFERILCDQLILPSHIAPTGNHEASLVHELRERFLQHLESDSSNESTQTTSEFGNRIYISRRLANRRRIHNEDETMSVLKQHGFVEFVAEQHDWETQIRVVAGADSLVSNHGGGLASIMMMKPGSSVLEMRDSIGPTPNCFFNLASASDLKFFYLLCEREGKKKDSHWSDIIVDPANLDRTLTQMLASA